MGRLVFGNTRTFAMQLLWGMLFLSVMFFSSGAINEPEVLSKWYAFLLGATVLCGLFLCTTDCLSFSLDRFTCVLAAFILYVCVWNTVSYIGIVSLLSPLVFFILFLCFRSFPDQLNRLLPLIVVSVCVLQSLYGILQYFGVFHVSNLFTVIGSFDNPGGFAACLSAGFPFCFVLFKESRKHFIAGLFSVVAILVAVSLSGSRSGILAIVVTLLIFFAIKYFGKLRRKGWWLCGSILLLIGLGTLLFILKKDSALGRLLVWENSLYMIKDKPLLGHGPGGFSASYMAYQANYFAQHPESSYSQLADIVNYPFNDYLLLGIEYGLVGLLFLIVILFMLSRASHKITVFHFCILSIGLFACSSYPLRYPFVLLLLAYSLAGIIRGQEGNRIKLKAAPKFFVGGICLVFLALLSRDVYFEVRWKKLVNLSMLGKTRDVLPDYANLYREWNHNPLFLYNYGALLNRTSDYSLSNAIMFECKKHLNDYDIQMIIADNYYQQKEWEPAEERYLEASRMCPNRFMPLYRLFSIYQTKGEVDRVQEVGNVISNKPVKIMSKVIYSIQEEVSTVLNAVELNN